MSSPNLIIFITGAFISNSCWEDWIIYFNSKGYNCIAPAWPYKDAPAEELRNRPADNLIATNTLSSLTKHFASIIEALPEKPVVIGHSLGGLIVQLLLQRELVSAGVAIHSFPPQGVNKFRLSFIKAIWESMMLFSSDRKTYLMSFSKWKLAIANAIDYEQQKELYYRYAIPESKRIVREAFNCVEKIDFKQVHAPLLFTSGGNDKLIPALLNYRNYKRYAAGNSVTDYIEFKSHTHLLFGVPGWKEEADCILHWLQGLK